MSSRLVGIPHDFLDAKPPCCTSVPVIPEIVNASVTEWAPAKIVILSVTKDPIQQILHFVQNDLARTVIEFVDCYGSPRPTERDKSARIQRVQDYPISTERSVLKTGCTSCMTKAFKSTDTFFWICFSTSYAQSRSFSN